MVFSASTTQMSIPKPSLLLLLLLVTFSCTQKLRPTEARTPKFLTQENHSKFFAKLGLVCKCCEGNNGECANTWTGTCHNLQCLPWKIDH